MSKWIGYAVSVNCGEPLGCYQGTILEADGTTITLTKAFRNGFPYPKSQVTLNAADIRDLKIIESKAEPPEQTHSTVAVSKNSKKNHKATVCENLQANQTNAMTGAQPARAARGPRSKPIDIQPPRSKQPATHSAGSFGNSGSTPKSRGAGGGGGGGGGAGGGQEKARRRNEACFGAAASPAVLEDFDFEGNLALFDKRALWEEMRAAQPDVVRAAAGQFRHDESVLEGAGSPARARLHVPDALRGPRGYVTDAGAAVPAVLPRVRRELWAGMQRLGLLDSAHALLARAAADVALRLVGGGRRLDPRNAHQAPCVVALVGPHRAGAAGLAAARLLASHGARAAALRPAGGGACAALQRELAAAALGDVRVAERAELLPRPDLVLLALHDPAEGGGEEEEEAGGEALQWAARARAAVVALEPPARGWAGVRARAAVVALAPPWLPADLGRVYLANVAPPHRLFSDRRMLYRAPFGASPLLPLHPADADGEDE